MRLLGILILDALVFFTAALFAFYLKYFPDVAFQALDMLIATIVIIRLVSFVLFGFYRSGKSYRSLKDWLQLLNACFAASVFAFVIACAFGAWIVWPFMTIDFLACLFLISFLRFFGKLKDTWFQL